MLCRNFILPEFANYVSFFLLSFCATYLTLSKKEADIEELIPLYLFVFENAIQLS